MTRRRRRTRRAAAAALTLLALTGCSGVPGGIVKPGRMARVLADMEVAESVIEADRPAWQSDSARRVLRQAIFARHGVTVAEVDTSLGWYARHPDKYEPVLAEASKILEKRLAEARAGRLVTPKGRSTAFDGDSIDVWGERPRRLTVSATQPVRLMTFNLGRDRFNEPGDVYVLRFRVVDPGREGAEVRASIGADYPGGRVMSAAERATAARPYTTLVLRTDSAITPLHVFGAITVTPPDAWLASPSPAHRLYVDSITLTRVRPNRYRPH